MEKEHSEWGKMDNEPQFPPDRDLHLGAWMNAW